MSKMTAVFITTDCDVCTEGHYSIHSQQSLANLRPPSRDFRLCVLSASVSRHQIQTCSRYVPTVLYTPRLPLAPLISIES